jgi:EAL domain-containing protein (putative c-di-GMP-specific phosphodiesterase class I)
VAEQLHRHGVEPSRLCLEVTESAAVADLAAARNTLQQLRSLGVRIALDDFGTGYSSLSYLRRLPVDVLKIDKSFVDDLTDDHAGDHAGDRTDTTGAAVLSGIVALSSALGLVTVAEGIETERSHRLVRGAGCTWGQGYLFARPLPLDEAAAHLAVEAQNARDRSTTA